MSRQSEDRATRRMRACEWRRARENSDHPKPELHGESRHGYSYPLICEGAPTHRPDQAISPHDRRISGFGPCLALKNPPRRREPVPALYALCPRCGFAAGDRGASSRMTSSKYRPVNHHGSASIGEVDPVPSRGHPIRRGRLTLRVSARTSSVRLVLRTSSRAPLECSRFALRTGCARRVRSASAPHAQHAT